MDWRLCPRVWRILACAGLPAPFKARRAIAESTGRREESLSPDKPCLLASLCSAQKDNLKHADRALARLTAGGGPSVSNSRAGRSIISAFLAPASPARPRFT